METAADYLEIDATLASSSLVLLYCSQPSCNVCKSLLPKVEDLLKEYPKITPLYVNLEDIPEFSGQHTVFNMPTVLFFAEGKEQFRLVRAFGIGELEEKIQRIYQHF
jgi:thioredoxin-like negative regulator of GroEL